MEDSAKSDSYIFLRRPTEARFPSTDGRSPSNPFASISQTDFRGGRKNRKFPDLPCGCDDSSPDPGDIFFRRAVDLPDQIQM